MQKSVPTSGSGTTFPAVSSSHYNSSTTKHCCVILMYIEEFTHPPFEAEQDSIPIEIGPA
jgi:hypothetical protein